MSSIEQTERKVESEAERTETGIEQIEREVNECEQRIAQLEADIRAVSSAGDRAAAAAMEGSLARERIERMRLEVRAEQEAKKLRGLQATLRDLYDWSTELRRIEARAREIGINTSEVEKRIADRDRWLKQQWARVLGLLQRVGRLST